MVTLMINIKIMKNIAIIAISLCFVLASNLSLLGAEPDYKPQLTQLAGEFATMMKAGTSDSPFSAIKYDEGKIVFTLAENSQVNQAFYSTDDFDMRDQLLNMVMEKMFSGPQGIQLLEFLESTRTGLLMEMPLPRDPNGAKSEKSFWPGDLKKKLQK